MLPLLASGLLDFIVGSPNPAVPQNFLEAFVALALVALSPQPRTADTIGDLCESAENQAQQRARDVR